jgi:hypothetical protein
MAAAAMLLRRFDAARFDRPRHAPWLARVEPAGDGSFDAVPGLRDQP